MQQVVAQFTEYIIKPLATQQNLANYTQLSVYIYKSYIEELMPDFNYRIENKDAFKWLKSIEDESIDLVVTDPPYESLEKHRSVGTTTRLKNSKSSSNEWFPIVPNCMLNQFVEEIFRVLKKNTHFYLYCDSETMFYIKPIAEEVGFKFWKPIIWDKVKIGMGYHYRARYENILFFEKGKRKLNDLSIPDVLECERVFNGYPTEKPVEISQILVEQSSLPGELVLDPFMGAGSTAEAAITCGRKFLGTDIKENAVKIARKRLREINKKRA